MASTSITITRSLITTAAIVALAGTWVACSASEEDMSAARDSGFGGSPSSSGTSTSSGMGGSGGSTLPPEEELESSFGAPVATGKYVWIANPTSGRVAYIDAESLQIDVVEAGNAPTYLAPVPHATADVAVVLNVLSLDATLLRAAEGGVLAAISLEVPSGGNSWAISEDGRWATAWTDARGIENPDPLDGYQDITVLDLTEGQERSIRLTVGYRPVALAYDSPPSRLFAVTEDGITIVDLTAPEPLVVANVELSDDPLEDTSTRDVAITPDGSYALVRRDGVADVSIFSLTTEARVDVTFAAPATDMDLSPDGSVAVVVIRDTGQVALLPIPDIFDDPLAFTTFSVGTVIIGSVALAPKSPVGFLYTNAVPSSVLTVFDSSSSLPAPSFVSLHAPIKAVFPTPDATHAVILHNALELGEGTGYPEAFSLVPVAAELPSKIQGLEAPLISLAIAPSGEHVLLAVGDSVTKTYGMILAKLPSLQLDSYQLASLPIAAGIVAGANRGFVAQEHPDGRISFINLDDGEVRTLTGFELASEVVNGGGK